MSQRLVPVPPERLSLWRRIALHVWGEPASPTICATKDYDVEAAVKFLDAFNAKHDSRVTITGLLVKIAADSLVRFPELNRRIVGQRLYDLPTIDIAAPVNVGGKSETAMILIKNADKKSLLEIASDLKGRAAASKESSAKLEKSGDAARLLDFVPPFVLTSVVGAAKRAIAGAHLEELLPNVDVSPGSFSVSSLGMSSAATFTGLSLMPPPGLGLVASMIIGHVEKKPVVENDQIVIRQRMPIMVFFAMVFEHARSMVGVSPSTGRSGRTT